MLTHFAGQKTPKQKKIFSKIIVLLMVILVFSYLTGCASSSSSNDYSSSRSEQNSSSIDSYAASGPAVIFDGRGKTATNQMAMPSPYSKVTFTHNGSSNFVVKVYYGNDYDLLVNEIGYYKGTTLILTNEKVTFDIDADGSWTGKLAGVGKSYSASFSGTGVVSKTVCK
jgi:hypothetical protein